MALQGRFHPRRLTRDALEMAWLEGLIYVVEYASFKLLGPSGRLNFVVIKELTIKHGADEQTLMFKPPKKYRMGVGEVRQLQIDERMSGQQYTTGLIPYCLLARLLLEIIPPTGVCVTKGGEKAVALSAAVGNNRNFYNLEDTLPGMPSLDDLAYRHMDNLRGHYHHRSCSEANVNLVYLHLTDVLSESDGARW